MMKNKFILAFSILVFLLIVVLIGYDFYTRNSRLKENVNELDIENLKEIDTTLIKYKELNPISCANKEITGLAISSKGILFACYSNGVDVFDSVGKALYSFSLKSPATSICFGKNNELILGLTDHVEMYSVTGRLLNSWVKINEQQYITSIACNDENVFVADAENKIIYKYDFDGKYISSIGKKDSTKNCKGFILPSMYFDVKVDREGQLWAANTGRHQLENYADNGDLRTSWGFASALIEGFVGCCNPIHFAILENGFFVTYEKGLNRIKVYNQAGEFNGVVAGSSHLEKCNTNSCSSKAIVNDLAIGPNNTIYIADAFSNAIRIFIEK